MMGKKYGLWLVLVVTAHLSAAPAETDKTYSSGVARVPLIELYTSEGCSSCPPADWWLSGLADEPGLWRDFTPIAFHVDYWDYIGWKDRFAEARFSDRQRRYAAEGGVRVVYTPGVFINGSEFRDWRSGATPQGDSDDVGELIIRISGENIAARFEPRRDDHRNLRLHIARVGMKRESNVDAGENNGKLLRHDFVALDVVSAGMSKSGSGYKALAQVPGITGKDKGEAVIAWVSGGGRQAPLQSVGGFLAD